LQNNLYLDWIIFVMALNCRCCDWMGSWYCGEFEVVTGLEFVMVGICNWS